VGACLELSLDRGVDQAACDNQALEVACWHGHTEVVRLLLELPLLDRGINPVMYFFLQRTYENCSFAPRFAAGKRCGTCVKREFGASICMHEWTYGNCPFTH